METPVNANTGERSFLFLFGVASVLYTAMLTISISALIALRLQFAGLILATFKIGSMVIGQLRKLFRFLLYAKETEPVRSRAKLVAAGVAISIPAVLFVIPIPTGIQVQGIVSAKQSTVIRAKTAGIVRQVEGLNNESIQAGAKLATLENIDASTEQTSESLTATASRKNAIMVSRSDLAAATKLRAEAIHQQARWQQASQKAEGLIVRAPHDGKLVFMLPDYARGVYVNVGDPIAKVVAGNTVVRAYLDEEQVSHAEISPGSRADIRLSSQAGNAWQGIIRSVAPARVEEIADLALTTVSSGEIAVNPETGETQKPMFLVEVAIADLPSHETLQDLRARVLLGRKYDTLGLRFFRSIRNFTNSIFAN